MNITEQKPNPVQYINYSHIQDGKTLCLRVRYKAPNGKDKDTYKDCFVTTDNKKLWICKMCGMDVSIYDNKVSNFKSHMKKHHPYELTLEDRETYGVYPFKEKVNTIDKMLSYETNNNMSKRELASIFSKCIINGGYSINSYCNSAIKDLVRQLIGSANLEFPSRSTLTRYTDDILINFEVQVHGKKHLQKL
jgi:hypothetical protein